MRACTQLDLAALDRAGTFGIALSEGHISVRLRFDAETGRAFKSTKYSETQRVSEGDDGTVIVEFETPNTMELRWWILGYGRKCEVLEPSGLREEIEAAVRPEKSA